jgi:hypothetical protein
VSALCQHAQTQCAAACDVEVYWCAVCVCVCVCVCVHACVYSTQGIILTVLEEFHEHIRYSLAMIRDGMPTTTSQPFILPRLLCRPELPGICVSRDLC